LQGNTSYHLTQIQKKYIICNIMSDTSVLKHATDITVVDFENLKQTNDLVLIDFWAEWCGPCRIMGPIIETIAPDFPTVKFLNVNVDDIPELAELFGVQGIPAFYMIKFSGNGSFDLQKNTVGKLVGASSAFDFKQAVAKLVEKSENN
jgi:thioredoxin 1